MEEIFHLVKLLLFLLKYRTNKIKFGKWAKREDVAAQVAELDDKMVLFPSLVSQYISLSFNVPEKWISILPWEISLGLFFISQSKHVPKKIPLILPSGEGNLKKVGWEYPGRGSVYWCHLLAYAYGWSVEYIQGLDIDTALALIEEIMVEKQLEHEFYWGLSEIAYPYNANTQKGEFKPMARPYFMNEPAPEIKMVKIRKDMMPVGQFVDPSGMVGYYEEKAKANSTQS